MKTSLLAAVLIGACASFALAADKKDQHAAVLESIDLFKKKDTTIAQLFTNAHAYAVFPGVAKGGLVFGGAGGRGEVYEQGKLIGTASLSQFTFGAQIGGQVYDEVIFFENKPTLERFKQSKYEMSAQLSAVAAAEGAAKNARYQQGVMVFTLARSGLMAEASVGGQKFNFKPLK